MRFQFVNNNGVFKHCKLIAYRNRSNFSRTAMPVLDEGELAALKNLEKERLEKLETPELTNLLNIAHKANHLEAAIKVFQNIRKPSGQHYFHYISVLEMHSMSACNVAVRYELAGIWSKLIASGNDGDPKLVLSLLTALSFSGSEQRKLINQVISKAPIASLNSSVLTAFLKYCKLTNDKELANSVWEWGARIRRRDFGSQLYFITGIQYYGLLDNSVSELIDLWDHITECRKNTDYFLVTAMCSALSIDPDRQRQFISQVISRPPNPTFDCGLLGSFLVPCENNLPLAQRVWAWGIRIRERERGTETLACITIQYLRICSESRNLDLIESVWQEAELFRVAHEPKLKRCYLAALASNQHPDLKCFEKFGTDSMNIQSFTMLLKSLADTGDCDQALELLRRFQGEKKPFAVSIIQYTVVVGALCEKGDFEAALSLIEEAKSHGHTPSLVTWKIVLNLCGKKHRNLPVALKAFEEIKRIERDEHNLSVAYSMMVNACRACGDEVKAAEIEEERNNQGLVHGRFRVDLDLEGGGQKISFFSNLTASSSFGPKVMDKIDRQLNDWQQLLEARGVSTGPIQRKYTELIALAYAVAVLNMRVVTLRKNLRLSEESHEVNRVLAGILGIEIRHWDHVNNRQLKRLHRMSDGKCDCNSASSPSSLDLNK